ncbi:MAG: hypothetical protein R2751_15920 [Bacteroidales bacterium]
MFVLKIQHILPSAFHQGPYEPKRAQLPDLPGNFLGVFSLKKGMKILSRGKGFLGRDYQHVPLKGRNLTLLQAISNGWTKKAIDKIGMIRQTIHVDHLRLQTLQHIRTPSLHPIRLTLVSIRKCTIIGHPVLVEHSRRVQNTPAFHDVPAPMQDRISQNSCRPAISIGERVNPDKPVMKLCNPDQIILPGYGSIHEVK